MTQIKRVGQEISGDLYITRNGTYIIDVNFNPNNPYFHSLTINDPDGEPNRPLKAFDYEIVDEFEDEEFEEVVNTFDNE